MIDRDATERDVDTRQKARAMTQALEAEAELRNLTGPDLIAAATARIAGTQADLARLSGMTGNTITALRKGKRPSAAQRAAILWAIARRWG